MTATFEVLPPATAHRLPKRRLEKALAVFDAATTTHGFCQQVLLARHGRKPVFLRRSDPALDE